MTQTLQSFFTISGQRRALESYGRFARGSAWSVPMKMDLYEFSHAAFVERRGEDRGLSCFRRIYDNLASYWQVFRPKGKDKCWSAERMFAALNEHFGPWSQTSSVTLSAFQEADSERNLLAALRTLRTCKPANAFPVMTVSKFLHFFNPCLFPIFDSQVVDQRVFRAFRHDYVSFCKSNGLDLRANGERFFINYLGWARCMLSLADDGFMRHFVAWLEMELPPRQFGNLNRRRLASLEATAFEFTAIGAAVIGDPSAEQPDCEP